MHDDALFDAIRLGVAQRTPVEDLQRDLWRRFGVDRAVLVLDSSGFTRITQAHGIVHFLASVVRMRDAVLPVLDKHGCLTSRAEADNIFALFDNADSALNAAFESHRALVDQNVMLTESEPFTVCIGIGYGHVLRSDQEGAFGDEMNLASKLGEDVAEAREILLTQAAYDAIAPSQHAHFEICHNTVSGVSLSYYRTVVS